MGYDGANWDGQIPLGEPSAPVSPFFESPITRSIAPGKIPVDSEHNPFTASFAPWCSWVYIQSAGGADSLNILPGIGGGEPVAAGAGEIVWIGNGRCGAEYVGAAPTSPIRMIGCTAAQASVYASQGITSAVSGAAQIPNGTLTENEILNGSEQTVTPPAGTLYTVVTANASTTSPCTVKSAGSTGNTSIGGSSVNSAVTIYGNGDITVSGANGQSIDFIFYTRS